MNVKGFTFSLDLYTNTTCSTLIHVWYKVSPETGTVET